MQTTNNMSTQGVVNYLDGVPRDVDGPATGLGGVWGSGISSDAGMDGSPGRAGGRRAFAASGEAGGGEAGGEGGEGGAPRAAEGGWCCNLADLLVGAAVDGPGWGAAAGARTSSSPWSPETEMWNI